MTDIEQVPSITYKIRCQNFTGEMFGVFVTVAGTPEHGIRWIFTNSKEMGIQGALTPVVMLLSESFQANAPRIPMKQLEALIDVFDPSGGYIVEGTGFQVSSHTSHVARVVWNACIDLGLGEGEMDGKERFAV